MKDTLLFVERFLIGLFIFFLIVFALSSCGANYHLRRAQHHIKKAELKGATVTTDTVYKTIPVITERVTTDTLIEKIPHNDTIFIEKDRIKMKLLIDTVKQTLYATAECKSDTVYVETPIAVNQNIESQKGFGYWLKWLLLVLVLGAGLGYYLRSRNNIQVTIRNDKPPD